MNIAAGAEMVEPRGRGLWVYAGRRFIRNPKGVICLAVILVVYLAGIFAPWVAPYPYDLPNSDLSLKPPSWQHPFGNDINGRDQLSRIIYGVRTTVIVTLAAMIAGGMMLGIALGLISGYFGRVIDGVIMRIGEVFLAFPDILLVILMAATLKPRVTS